MARSWQHWHSHHVCMRSTVETRCAGQLRDRNVRFREHVTHKPGHARVSKHLYTEGLATARVTQILFFLLNGTENVFRAGRCPWTLSRTSAALALTRIGLENGCLLWEAPAGAELLLS